MEMGVLKVVDLLEVMEPLEMVGLDLPPAHGVHCLHLTWLWNSFVNYGEITKGLALKSLGICRNFSISFMKAYKRPTHECIG